MDKKENIILGKQIYLDEDFYDQLINGLDQYNKQEENNSLIMSTNQKTFMRKMTLPIIMKFVKEKGLYSDYIKFRNDKNLKRFQDFASIDVILDLISFQKNKELEEDEEEEGGGFNFMKLWSIYRNFKMLKQIFDAFKNAKKSFQKIREESESENKKINIYSYDFNSRVHQEMFKNDLYSLFSKFEKESVPVLSTYFNLFGEIIMAVAEKVFGDVVASASEKVAEKAAIWGATKMGSKTIPYIGEILFAYDVYNIAEKIYISDEEFEELQIIIPDMVYTKSRPLIKMLKGSKIDEFNPQLTISSPSFSRKVYGNTVDFYDIKNHFEFLNEKYGNDIKINAPNVMIELLDGFDYTTNLINSYSNMFKTYKDLSFLTNHVDYNNFKNNEQEIVTKMGGLELDKYDVSAVKIHKRPIILQDGFEVKYKNDGYLPYFIEMGSIIMNRKNYTIQNKEIELKLTQHDGILSGSITVDFYNDFHKTLNNFMNSIIKIKNAEVQMEQNVCKTLKALMKKIS